MLYSYEDCVLKFGNDYQIKKMQEVGQISRILPGIYTDAKKHAELDIVCFKYPKAVFTSYSAFYYHSLTDTIPDMYYLGTLRDSAKITDERVKQSFYREEVFHIGIERKLYQNINIQIYDKERMLIELIRGKKKMPFDFYKEVIGSYRRITDNLDIEKLQEYVVCFPAADSIFKAIQLEVF